jgi:hypothetical protein
MPSKAQTVEQYLASLPPDRRGAIEAVRNVLLANLDRGLDGRSGYEEGMQYGMIGYYVPHSLFPAGYHCDPRQPLPFAALASQKNYMSLYLMGVYCGCMDDGSDMSPEAKWFRQAWAKTGKKLDMGKACIRFRRVEDLALDVIGEAIRRLPAATYVRRYQSTLAMLKTRPVKGPPGRAKPSAKGKPATPSRTTRPAPLGAMVAVRAKPKGPRRA